MSTMNMPQNYCKEVELKKLQNMKKIQRVKKLQGNKVYNDLSNTIKQKGVKSKIVQTKKMLLQKQIGKNLRYEYLSKKKNQFKAIKKPIQSFKHNQRKQIPNSQAQNSPNEKVLSFTNFTKLNQIQKKKSMKSEKDLKIDQNQLSEFFLPKVNPIGNKKNKSQMRSDFLFNQRKNSIAEIKPEERDKSKSHNRNMMRYQSPFTKYKRTYSRNQYKTKKKFDKNLDLKKIKRTIKIDSKHQKALSQIKDSYETIQILGEGNFAYIFLGKDVISGQLVAIKLSKSDMVSLQLEYELLKQFDSPNIIKVYDFIKIENLEALILEYGGVRTLRSFQQKQSGSIFNEKYTINYLQQTINALKTLHDKNIAHSDLKLENILLEDDNEKSIKLIDFGFSNFHENLVEDCYFGAMGYMSPQILQKKKFDPFKADIWALGILTYKMLFNLFPYKGKSEDEIYRRIKGSKLNFPSTIKASKNIKNFINFLLTKKEKDRPNIDEVQIKFFNIFKKQINYYIQLLNNVAIQIKPVKLFIKIPVSQNIELIVVLNSFFYNKILSSEQIPYKQFMNAKPPITPVKNILKKFIYKFYNS